MSLPPVLLGVRSRVLVVLGALAFLAPLLTRLVLGNAFMVTGTGKIANIERTTAFFADLGIPAPGLNALFVSRLEYWGGLALILGLGTRLFAALLGSTMITALMTADNESLLNALRGVGDSGLLDVTPVVYGMFLLWLMLSGPGLLSVDKLLTTLLKLEEPSTSKAGG